MSKYTKKIFIAVVAALMLMMPLSVFADNDTAETSTEETQQSETVPTPIVAGELDLSGDKSEQQSESADENQNTDQKEQRSDIMSVGGVILLFILSILINAVISFAVANRFYKLSKKDSHIQSEIRALRRDIDEKFTGSIKDIREQNVKVSNTNPGYADEMGIKSTSKRAEKHSSANDDAIAELAKKWNIEIERDEEPQVKIKPSRNEKTGARTSGYSPNRAEAPIEKQSVTPDEDLKTAVKSHAKKVMNDIFPLDNNK